MSTTVYIGMDVHSTNYTLSSYIFEEDKHFATVKLSPETNSILNYIKRIRKEYGDDTDVEQSISEGEAYRIMADGRKAGGVIVSVDGRHGELEILFTLPEHHSKGIGYKAWCEVEKLYPDVEVWETATPYFETRNIHFYVNKLGFHIVEFYNSHHPDPNDPDMAEEMDEQFPDGMFRFEKRMK